MNLTGHIWAFNSEFIQIAKFFGIYGLSFLTIIWFVLLSNLIIERKFKTFFLILIFFPIILFSFNLNNFNKKNIESEEILIRVVQPNILQNKKWNKIFFEENIQKLINLTVTGNDPSIPKIVVWPEVALTLYLNEEQDFLNYLRNKIPPNIILITGALRRVFENEKIEVFNSLYVLKENKIIHYDKKKLVPFGEFIPLRKFVNFLKITPGSTDFTKGKGLRYLEIELENKQIFLEPSICYEAIFQTFNKRETQLMINITNDAWFGNTTGPRQHLAAQIFRAVEKSAPLIRSANSGISVLANTKGKIIKKLALIGRVFLMKN